MEPTFEELLNAKRAQVANQRAREAAAKDAERIKRANRQLGRALESSDPLTRQLATLITMNMSRSLARPS